jgi:hypothetical protein
MALTEQQKVVLQWEALETHIRANGQDMPGSLRTPVSAATRHRT